MYSHDTSYGVYVFILILRYGHHVAYIRHSAHTIEHDSGRQAIFVQLRMEAHYRARYTTHRHFERQSFLLSDVTRQIHSRQLS